MGCAAAGSRDKQATRCMRCSAQPATTCAGCCVRLFVWVLAQYFLSSRSCAIALTSRDAVHIFTAIAAQMTFTSAPDCAIVGRTSVKLNFAGATT
ncbi:conserved hypothetical protein [Ricinus communis]|uniref:Uncharacterized protein n=1 Tax=Ricinus communis TaxID=3988 RepID=B9TQ77_RICCO|nr:conserved hypothetical protein [Ricinus communis]